jgi:hypothetical protein
MARTKSGTGVDYSLRKHCTDQEDAATKVERRINKSAAALLLSGRFTKKRLILGRVTPHSRPLVFQRCLQHETK